MAELAKYALSQLDKANRAAITLNRIYPAAEVWLIGSLARHLKSVEIPRQNRFTLDSDADLAVRFPLDITDTNRDALIKLIENSFRCENIQQGDGRDRVQIATTSSFNFDFPRWALTEINQFGIALPYRLQIN